MTPSRRVLRRSRTRPAPSRPTMLQLFLPKSTPRMRTSFMPPSYRHPVMVEERGGPFHKGGRIPAEWANKPAKLAQKDRDARWTVKWSKAKPADDGSSRIDLAVPAFGYKNHVGIDRRHGLIRTWTVTDAARHDGAQLPGLISKANTG